MSKKLILASEFDVGFPKIKPLLGKRTRGKRVLYIPTAAYGEGYEPDYDENIRPFEDLRMKVIKCDLAGESEKDLAEILTDIDIIYVTGGNTFYLLEHMNKCKFKKLLLKKLSAGTVYMGSSAGSIVVSPDIGFIRPMDDPNIAHLDDCTGLGLIDFCFLPHLDHVRHAAAAKQIVEKYDNERVALFALNDNQVVYVNDDVVKIL